MIKRFVVGKLYRYGRTGDNWNSKEYKCIRISGGYGVLIGPDKRTHTSKHPTVWWYLSPKNGKLKITYWR